MQDFPTILFKMAQDWEEWLEQNYAKSSGVWIQFAKKNSGITSISYQEALDVALYFGWIDSRVKKFDEKLYLQKFSPRRAKSIWSKTNTARVQELIKQKKMRLAGLRQVEQAKQDGRWDAAYHPPSTIKVPDEFIVELKKTSKHMVFIKLLTKQIFMQ